MKHGSLFSGIGGFDLAAEWMGWENIFHCEWNPFGQKVLKYYWPNAESFTDITKTDFTKYANTIDILTGGFPCQPYSSAGKRKGKEDERHLWPHMLRAIKEIAPRYIVGENVRGLTNWNGGLVFDEVCVEMENIGYQVAPFLIPACGINAPHKRERIWFVAHSNNNGLNQRNSNNEVNTSEGRVNALGYFEQSNGDGIIAYPNNKRHTPSAESTKIEREWSKDDGIESKRGKSSKWIDGLDGFQRDITNTGVGGMEGHRRQIEGQQLQTTKFDQDNSEKFRRLGWETFPTQSPICNGDDGLSAELDGITFSQWRKESIKAGGNAIVPQVVYQIFKAIEQHEILTAPAPDIRQFV